MLPNYRDLNAVPRAWRRLKGYPLTFEQAVSIIHSAHNRQQTDKVSFPEGLRLAREQFQKNNRVDEQRACWVPN